MSLVFIHLEHLSAYRGRFGMDLGIQMKFVRYLDQLVLSRLRGVEAELNR